MRLPPLLGLSLCQGIAVMNPSLLCYQAILKLIWSWIPQLQIFLSTPDDLALSCSQKTWYLLMCRWSFSIVFTHPVETLGSFYIALTCIIDEHRWMTSSNILFQGHPAPLKVAMPPLNSRFEAKLFTVH